MGPDNRLLQLMHSNERTQLQLTYRVAFSGKKSRIASDEVLARYDQMKEAVDFVTEHFLKTRIAGITHLSIAAGIVRAWFGVEDKQVLKRFCEILRGEWNGDVTERDAPAFTLRDHLMRNVGNWWMSDAQTRIMGLRTQGAIRAVVNGLAWTRVAAPRGDLYHIPGEEAGEKKEEKKKEEEKKREKGRKKREDTTLPQRVAKRLLYAELAECFGATPIEETVGFVDKPPVHQEALRYAHNKVLDELRRLASGAARVIAK